MRAHPTLIVDPAFALGVLEHPGQLLLPFGVIGAVRQAHHCVPGHPGMRGQVDPDAETSEVIRLVQLDRRRYLTHVDADVHGISLRIVGRDHDLPER